MRLLLAVTFLVLAGCSAQGVDGASEFTDAARQVAGLVQHGVPYGASGLNSGLSVATQVLGAASAMDQGSNNLDDGLSSAEGFVNSASNDPQFATTAELLSARQHIQEARSYLDMADDYAGAYNGQSGVSMTMERANRAMLDLKQDLINFRSNHGEHYGVSEVIEKLE